MAKITDLAAVATPADTDLLETVQDVATTPVSKNVTWAVIKAWLGLPLFASSSGSAVTGQSLVDLGGLSVPLTAGTWVFEILLSAASSSTAGIRFGVQYSGTATSVDAVHIGQLSTTTWGATARITALNAASNTLGTTANAQVVARMWGKIVVTTSGNLTARGLKVTSGTLTVNQSSWITAKKVA